MRVLFYFAVLSLITFSLCKEAAKACQTSADCSGATTCEENLCVRQDLFPLNGREMLGTFISVVLNVVLNIGGVGGGAVHIPYIHLLYETTISKAVSISFACVFGASLGYVFCTVPKRDAKTNKYLINYDIALIALPALMVGVGFGTIVSKFLSPLMASIIIVFVLGYAIIKCAFKFRDALSKELIEENGRRIFQTPDTIPLEVKPIEAKAVGIKPEPVIIAAASIQDVMSKNDLAEQEQEPAKNFNKRRSLPASTIFAGSASTFDGTYSRVLSMLVKDNVPLANEQQIDIQVDNQSVNQIENKVEGQVDALSKLDHLNAKEEKFPIGKLLNLLVNVLSILVFGLIRGTKQFKSIFGVNWSLSWDFVWFGLGTFCFILATIKSINDVRRSQKEKQEAGYNFHAHEPVLNKKNLTTLLIRAVIGGFVSAVSTLAGAFVVGPALLGMGMPGAFAAATTNMFMILSMFNAMLGLLLNGTLSPQEVAWFMVFSFMFSVGVTTGLNLYVKRTGRESTVIGLILIGTVVGIMCLITTLMQAMLENLSEHTKFGSV